MALQTTTNRNTAADMQNAVSPIDDAAVEMSTKSRLWNSVADIVGQPYLVANTGLNFMAGSYIIWLLFSAGMGNHFQKIMEGDPTTLILSTVSLTALLCGTMGLKMLADQRNATKNDEDRLSMEYAAKEVLTSLDTNMKAVQVSHEDIIEKVDMIAARERDSWFRRPNDKTAWNRFAKDYPLTTIGGRCASEVRRIVDAKGNVLLQADLDLLRMCWLPRFTGDTKLSRIDHIVGYSDEADHGDEDRNPLFRLLATYRATWDIAADLGIDIDLSEVHISLIDPTMWTDLSVFMGYRVPGGRSNIPTPVTQRYSSIPLAVAGPLNMLVEVNFSKETHSNYQACADELIANAACTLNLQEAEERFGDRVPLLSNGSNTPIRFNPPKPGGDTFDMYGEYIC